ncbi:hypothetical protein [Neodiprion abietis nucleopolyhedrovirus]|uniref:Uncharacterized protein n=1 Tax=Neodiprion abietis nucleopolyhedrovirus TaxID=204507 RepID=Q0ZP09_9CBAC|nr:hypothetical protein [Neodiprion abietis nucleopolyhedrovirus]ABC74945.1 unknown [Neodiprion abietis nucleopolyhedrovirus]
MTICGQLDNVYISDTYLFPTKNMIENEARKLPALIPKETTTLCVILSLQEDVSILDDFETIFKQTLVTTQHDDGVLQNVVVMYITPIEPITTFGSLGTFVYSGFLTNFLYDCRSGFSFQRMAYCPIQEPTFRLTPKYVKLNGDNILENSFLIANAQYKNFNVCFAKRPLDKSKIVLNVKRLLILLSRYRHSTYILNLNDEIVSEVVKTLKFERLRRLLKFQQAGGLCPTIVTNGQLSILKLIQEHLHSDYSDIDGLMKMISYYKVLITDYGVIPKIYEIISNINESKNCGISVHCNGTNKTVTPTGIIPPNVDICNTLLPQAIADEFLQNELRKSGINTPTVNIKRKPYRYYWS